MEILVQTTKNTKHVSYCTQFNNKKTKTWITLQVLSQDTVSNAIMMKYFLVICVTGRRSMNKNAFITSNSRSHCGGSQNKWNIHFLNEEIIEGWKLWYRKRVSFKMKKIEDKVFGVRQIINKSFLENYCWKLQKKDFNFFGFF